MMAAKKKTAKRRGPAIVHDCGGSVGLSKTRKKCATVKDYGGRVGLARVAKKKAAPKKKTARKKAPARKVTTARRNPAPVSVQRQIDQGLQLFKDFRGDEPQGIDRVKLPPQPKVLMMIGECSGVMYETIRDGEKETYLHRFKKSSRPALCCTPDGKTLYLIGGVYQVTDRGIVDR